MTGLNLSPTQARILELLIAKGGEMYGRELAKEPGAGLKQGAIYVTLQRMEERGYVESRTVAHKGPGLPRRMYKPTNLGRVLSEAWGMAGMRL